VVWHLGVERTAACMANLGYAKVLLLTEDAMNGGEKKRDVEGKNKHNSRNKRKATGRRSVHREEWEWRVRYVLRSSRSRESCK
jgi:hypothetical protein